MNTASALLAHLGQIAYLIGHDGESLAVLAGACRLDGCVQREQVGLICDSRYSVDNLANLFGLPFQLRDHLRGVEVGLRRVADALDEAVEIRGRAPAEAVKGIDREDGIRCPLVCHVG